MENDIDGDKTSEVWNLWNTDKKASHYRRITARQLYVSVITYYAVYWIIIQPKLRVYT
jgi:hypothetical protein